MAARGVAQLVARSVRDAEVVRSSRITPTIIAWVQFREKSSPSENHAFRPARREKP